MAHTYVALSDVIASHLALLRRHYGTKDIIILTIDPSYVLHPMGSNGKQNQIGFNSLLITLAPGLTSPHSNHRFHAQGDLINHQKKCITSSS
jgi:hypothetical protein